MSFPLPQEACKVAYVKKEVVVTRGVRKKYFPEGAAPLVRHGARDSKEAYGEESAGAY